ncbi:MAG: helix-turn-helix domain-containing protein [Syntrophobacterales bacterium]|nr:helix-turn-helix domain-containing protein [Syntrophobacterales bacterium]
METEKTLSPEQAGRYLGGDEKPLAKKTLDKWRWDGTGPVFIKVGRLIRYRTSDLDAWLAARRRRSTSDPGPQAM